MEFLFTNNRVEAYEDNKLLGYLEFSLDEEALTINKTLVYPEARGKGLAKLLNEKIFEYAKNVTKKIKIICSYSQNYYLKNKSQYFGFEVVLISGEENVCTI